MKKPLKKPTEKATESRKRKLRFKKPKFRHGPKRPHPNSLKNLRPPWKPGERGNPLSKNLKGIGVAEVHKAFNELLQLKGETQAPIVVEIFYKLLQLLMKKGSVPAGRALLDWGIGSPAQTVRIMPTVDINIGLAPDIEQPNLLAADNVAIIRGDSTQGEVRIGQALTATVLDLQVVPGV
ncbi:MAG: hypothetical protein ABSB63_21885 [Spirochaetia bacterium]